MDMTVRLMGGLGNRLFQIAHGLGYSSKYPKYTFCISPYYCNSYRSDQLGDHAYFYRNIHMKDMLNVAIKKEYHDQPGVYVDFPEYDEPICFEGYFQTEKYFIHIRDKILEEFGCPSSIQSYLMTKYPNLKNSIFLHIRRGDYVNHWLHFINLEQYYKECLEYFDSNIHVYICSDDIEWCKSSWLKDLPNKTFLDENEVYTLWIMSICEKGGICANSSFSWWGGWLNQNPDKKIYYPSKQFTNPNILTTDLIPETFIKLIV